jgi:hypothetical protein
MFAQRPKTKSQTRGDRDRRPRSLPRAGVSVITGAALGASMMFALGISGATSASASSKVTKVIAVETEYHIALSKKSFKPGKYLFVAENKGQVIHALAITGPGLSHASTKDLNPGQNADLSVTFKKGKYDIFCPIPGHKQLGMNVNIKT